MSRQHEVTLIPGDGVGPECVEATRRVIEAAGVAIVWDERHAGARVFRSGVLSGVPQDTIDSITRTRVVLKGPLETPVGFGEKSANVTLRKLFETYANVRPVRELPGVTTPYSGRGIDLVIVRENVEDLYAGIEHMQTPTVAQCLKLISQHGCEKIVRLAFELAVSEGRRRVHCATKANIMKLTEGLLKRTFEAISREYPSIEAQHIIIDNCAHQLVKRPEQFDVIVTTNMNGDIISDLTSALVGGLGFAPSANLGTEVAIFEAVHGSAPKYAGRDVINPTAVLMSAVMMLRHIGELGAAAAIEHAVLVTLEEGRHHTGDVVGYDRGASTRAYTDAVIANLGRTSASSSVRDHVALRIPPRPRARSVSGDRSTVGVDIFVESSLSPEELGRLVEDLVDGTSLRLKMISNRGTQVYPTGGAMIDCVDHWRVRLVAAQPDRSVDDETIAAAVRAVGGKVRWMHLEKLEVIDGTPGFTRAQGEN